MGIKLQPTTRVLTEASDQRFYDGKLLLKYKRLNGALIMFYYSTECLLKAKIAENSPGGRLPDEHFRHLDKYEDLVEAAGIQQSLKGKPEILYKLRTLAALNHTEIRYNQSKHSDKDSKKFSKYAEEIRQWLRTQF